MRTQHRIAALAGIALAGILAAGCKKDDSADASGGTGDGAALPVPEGKGAPEVAGQFNAANQAMEKNDYDAAIGALLQARQAEANMTEAQRQAYNQTVRDTTLKLLEASQTNPKAREAYENLGRMMTGR